MNLSECDFFLTSELRMEGRWFDCVRGMASPSLELVELINLVHGNICHGNSDILEIGLRRSLIECATRSSKPNTSRLLSLKAAQELYFFFYLGTIQVLFISNHSESGCSNYCNVSENWYRTLQACVSACDCKVVVSHWSRSGAVLSIASKAACYSSLIFTANKLLDNQVFHWFCLLTDCNTNSKQFTIAVKPEIGFFTHSLKDFLTRSLPEYRGNKKKFLLTTVKWKL